MIKVLGVKIVWSLRIFNLYLYYLCNFNRNYYINIYIVYNCYTDICTYLCTYMHTEPLAPRPAQRTHTPQVQNMPPNTDHTHNKHN